MHASSEGDHLVGPDDEALSAHHLEIASLGNVRTTTLRAYDEEEMSGILRGSPERALQPRFVWLQGEPYYFLPSLAISSKRAP